MTEGETKTRDLWFFCWSEILKKKNPSEKCTEFSFRNMIERERERERLYLNFDNGVVENQREREMVSPSRAEQAEQVRDNSTS